MVTELMGIRRFEDLVPSTWRKHVQTERTKPIREDHEGERVGRRLKEVSIDGWIPISSHPYIQPHPCLS